MSLLTLAQSYLECGGYSVAQKSDGMLDARLAEPKDGFASVMLLWAEDALLTESKELSAADRAARDARERGLLAAFKTAMAANPGATGVYLVNRRVGLSQSFVTEATRLLGSGGGVRVPVQMFDTVYKTDGETAKRSRGARSILGEVVRRGNETRRVAQPFRVRTGLGPDAVVDGDGDLVEVLDGLFMQPADGPQLILIDGAAGSGKTVAFNALTAALYAEFIEAKQAQEWRRRPIVFLPEHIRGEEIGYVDDVIDAVAQGEMSAAAEPEQFRWLLSNGFSAWMFDGLDEFYAGSTDFFTFLDAELSNPASRAQFVISARDSLLTSSDAMQAFLARHLRPGGPAIVYELAPWTAERWQSLAWLELEQGRRGAEQSVRVRTFVDTILASPTLTELAQLPFYCSVLLERYRKERTLPDDAVGLCSQIVNRMIDREHGKAVFSWSDFVDFDALTTAMAEDNPPSEASVLQLASVDEIAVDVLEQQGREAILEMIEGIAHANRRGDGTSDGSVGGGEGIAVNDLRELFAPSALGSDIGAEDQARLATVLVQLAFFGPGRKSGAVDFAHPILSDYLAGTYAVRLLSEEADRADLRAVAGRREGAFRTAIGTAEFVAGSMFHETLAHGMAHDRALRDFVLTLPEDVGRDNANRALAILKSGAGLTHRQFV